MENRKGFAPILLIVAVIVIAVVAGAGYVFTNKGKTGIQLPGAIVLNPNCKFNDAELCRFMDQSTRMTGNFEKGFSGKSVSVAKDGKKTETVWEMLGDKSHFQNLADGKEDANMIIIGNTTYTKDMADGKWFKYTAKAEGESSSRPGLFDMNQMKNAVQDTVKETEDKTAYKAMGKAACGNLTCFKYQVMNAQPGGREYLYFDDREYLMRMIEVTDGSGTTISSFNYGPVSISEPSPVKADDRFNMYDPSLMEKTQGGASSVDMNKLQKNVEEMMKNNSQLPQQGE